MKVPKAEKMSSGNWYIRLRLGGESINVTAPTEKACTREAAAIKAEYLAGKRTPPDETAKEVSPTLSEAIDKYISVRTNKLSPSTIRGYRMIQKNRFKALMGRRVDEIKPSEWDGIVNDEAALCSVKTLKNAYMFIRGVIHAETGQLPPMVSMPVSVPAKYIFLEPEQIKVFVQAVKDTRYAVPALLALSSMRISEIYALRWENIPKNAYFIRISGAVVLNENNKFQWKKANKNASSARPVPVLIPELRAALERDRKPSGPVVEVSQNRCRLAIKKICADNQLPPVTIHGLRHSFASLAYYLQVQERWSMEFGGWSDPGTMRKIYTHIAQSDVRRCQNAMADFYEGNSSSKNVN